MKKIIFVGASVPDGGLEGPDTTGVCKDTAGPSAHGAVHFLS